MDEEKGKKRKKIENPSGRETLELEVE